MHPTPLTTLFNQAEAMWIPYGDEAAGRAVMVAGAFDHVDIEYAAIRKSGSCGLLDQPTRATLTITGSDRVAFLNRMVTQELKGIADFRGVRSFWLSRKGRIDADLRVITLPDRILLDVDILAAERTRAGLEPYVIADDVQIADSTLTHHRLALHGPGAAAVLDRFTTLSAGVVPTALQPGHACIVNIATSDGGKHEIIVDRWDSTGEIGLELTVPSAHAKAIYETLLHAAHENVPGHTGANPRPLLRPIGWHAYNIARIEAGTPLYMLDFGPDALPAETGTATLNDRVSCKKGCYLGQEIVARMHALGAPKQTIVSLRLHDAHNVPGQPSRQPDTGSPVFIEKPAQDDQPIGAVSSSTTSPMLSGDAIALATVKTKHATPGTKLSVLIDGTALIPATVQENLASWKRA